MAIIGRLKQNTAATIVLGPFVSATDGATAQTALTIAQANVRLSKNAGIFAQTADTSSATHMEFGYYSKPVNATDTNTAGRLTVTVSVAGALPIRQEYEVLPAHEFDRLFVTTGPIPEMGIKARGTTQSATATGAVLASVEAFPDNVLVGDIIMLEVSAGIWVSRVITANLLSADSVTFDTVSPTPTGAIRYIIFTGAPSSSTSLPMVDVRKINNANVLGNGTAGNLWRGA